VSNPSPGISRSGASSAPPPAPGLGPGQRRLLVDTVLVGVAAGLAAEVFNQMLRLVSHLFLGGIAGYHPPGLVSEGGSPVEVIGPHGLWLIPVATTLGGLLAGLLIQRFAPETEGHGTDTVVRAFHRAQGFIRGRVPPVKLLASALTIGSGGSAGREGPVALVSGGMASWYATALHRPERERQMLVLIGMGAGLAAIFRSPVGTALFAVEVLYRDLEFEPDALLYTMLASVVAYAVHGLFVGFGSLFRVTGSVKLANPLDYGWFIVLGVAAGGVALGMPPLFYGVRDAFRRWKVKPALKPAIGGLAVGLLALVAPHVLSGGYGWLQAAIDGHVGTGRLLVLVLAEPVAMALTISSGGSGGIFAPTLFVGGMLGGLLAAIVHLPAPPFVVVGMAAVFAGAAHVPIAVLMMVTEMTGGYDLLVPAALAVMLSYLIQVRLSRGFKYRSLYEAQVPRRADSPAHHTEHLQIALRIIEERRLVGPLPDTHLNLVSLLRSGIPVELPDERRLTVGIVRAGSPLIGRPVGEEAGRLDGETTVITIIRGEHMIAVRPETRVEEGDRLILLTSEKGLEGLRGHVERW
jgi:CIC family chloride channel protein